MICLPGYGIFVTVDRLPSDIEPLDITAASLSAAQLRRRYIVALSLIAILTIASQTVMQILIADQEHDSRVVNIAGRQRMLSQKITKLSYYIVNAESPAAESRFRKDLEESLGLWERSHAGLLRGDAEMGLPGKNSREVVELFARIEMPHKAIVDAARTILSSTATAATKTAGIARIGDNEGPFLRGMDDIVFRYDSEAKKKIAFARWLETGLMSITLLVLMLEAAFIFAPAAKRIEHAMEELVGRDQDLERLFSVSPTALLMVDRNSLTILRANTRSTDLLGHSVEAITGANLRNYVDADYPANRGFLDKVAKGETLNEYEVVLVDARRSLLETLVSVRKVTFSQQPVFVLGITDISDLKKAQQTLEHLATFDEMSGLMNRRTGLMLLEKTMARIRREGGRLVVCFADIDGLKTANDRFGHVEGDWLIRTAAEVLTGIIRSSDAAVRLGGDEFLLLLNDCSLEEGAHLIHRAEKRLADIEVEEKKPFPMGFSYGVVAYDPDKHATTADLIADADRLMYQIKQQRKGFGGNGQ